jgi:hypothetical protein
MRDEEQGRGRSEVTSFGSGKKMSFDATSPAENGHFLSFPYVCPEPVLVK